MFIRHLPGLGLVLVFLSFPAPAKSRRPTGLRARDKPCPGTSKPALDDPRCGAAPGRLGASYRGNGGGWLMEIPQVVHDYVDAFARADVDGCVGAFAADGTYSDPGTGGPLSGQALRDHFAAFFGGFPDARCQTVSLDPVT